MLTRDDPIFLFIGGLHRSGTTPLYRALSTSPYISCFSDTGVIEDEGQFLQDVFPNDNFYGGPASFGLDPRSHWTETSPFVESAKEKLFEQWSRYWDLSSPILAEKSPANLIRSRFLKSIFPNAYFIFLVRHPIATCMATMKWTQIPIRKAIKNWISCYNIMHDDIQHLDNFLIIKYEDLTSNKNYIRDKINNFLGYELALDFRSIQENSNDKYYHDWHSGNFHIWSDSSVKRTLKFIKNRAEIKWIEGKYEYQINKFGYSFLSKK